MFLSYMDMIFKRAYPCRFVQLFTITLYFMDALNVFTYLSMQIAIVCLIFKSFKEVVGADIHLCPRL